MKMRFSMRRFWALVCKECLQIRRDCSVLVIGLGLPIVMLFVYGFGVSMDMRSVPVAIVLGERTPAAMELTQALQGNPFFQATVTYSRPQAERWMQERSIEAMVDIPAGFARDAAQGKAQAAVTVYGVDSNSALLFRNYLQGVLANVLAKKATQQQNAAATFAPIVDLNGRYWFNEAGISTWYLVPGIVVLVISVAGSFMGGLVIAREAERGTLHALFVSSASGWEVLLSKFAVYSVLVFAGFLICFVSALWVFSVPVRGSLLFLFTTALLYGAWAVALGLFVSAKTRNQFLAIEAAILLSFLPTLMLSGFLFDLRSVPWWIEVIGRLMPPTYAIESFRICFLSGGSAEKILLDLAILSVWTLGLLLGAWKLLTCSQGATRKSGGKRP